VSRIPLDEIFRRAIDVVEAEGIRYLVFGGIAFPFWGRAAATDDVDLVVQVTEPDVERSERISMAGSGSLTGTWTFPRTAGLPSVRRPRNSAPALTRLAEPANKLPENPHAPTDGAEPHDRSLSTRS